MKKLFLFISLGLGILALGASCNGSKQAKQESSPNYGENQESLDSIKAAKTKKKMQDRE